MTKQHVILIKDHSSSMRSLSRQAARDYNALLASLQDAARSKDIEIYASVIKCGIGPGKGRVEREVTNVNIQNLLPVSENYYPTDGNSTPLFDSVGEGIDICRSLYHDDYINRDLSFLVMVITDGYENDSRKW